MKMPGFTAERALSSAPTQSYREYGAAPAMDAAPIDWDDAQVAPAGGCPVGFIGTPPNCRALGFPTTGLPTTGPGSQCQENCDDSCAQANHPTNADLCFCKNQCYTNVCGLSPQPCEPSQPLQPLQPGQRGGSAGGSCVAPYGSCNPAAYCQCIENISPKIPNAAGDCYLHYGPTRLGMSCCPDIGNTDLNSDPENCGGCNEACPEGQPCCNGNCIPPTSQLSSNLNYNLYSPGCQPIEGLVVSFVASPELNLSAATNGFMVQLNAFQQGTAGNWLQFIFFVQNNDIIAQIQDHGTSASYIGGSSSTATFGNCNNQNLSIALTYDSNGAVNGAIFSVYNSDGSLCQSQPLSVPNTPHHTINAFQVNVGADKTCQYTTFTKGSGTITYEVANGQELCNLSIFPDQCNTNFTATCERSNILYGPLSSCCGNTLTQTFTA
jgi:hypothetical protein